MKKFILAALVATPLCACNNVQKSDFDIVSDAISVAGTDGIVAQIENTTVVKVPATKEMLAIYAKDKDSQFLNAKLDLAMDLPAETCLIEVVSANEYRVLCANASDVAADQMWAVSVTKPVATEPAPAEQSAEEQQPAEEQPAEAQEPVAE